jgi:hypothetical protein
MTQSTKSLKLPTRNLTATLPRGPAEVEATSFPGKPGNEVEVDDSLVMLQQHVRVKNGILGH